MKVDEIRNEREFYEAVRDYSSKVWQWGASPDYDDDTTEPMPDELLAILEERVQWVKAHKKAVDRYLARQGGTRWLRVFDGAKTETRDQSRE